MKRTEKFSLRREDASARLREYADMIDNGSMIIAGVATPVPEDVELELEYEDDEEKVEIEMELEWRK